MSFSDQQKPSTYTSLHLEMHEISARDEGAYQTLLQGNDIPGHNYEYPDLNKNPEINETSADNKNINSQGRQSELPVYQLPKFHDRQYATVNHPDSNEKAKPAFYTLAGKHQGISGETSEYEVSGTHVTDYEIKENVARHKTEYEFSPLEEGTDNGEVSKIHIKDYDIKGKALCQKTEYEFSPLEEETDRGELVESVS